MAGEDSALMSVRSNECDRPPGRVRDRFPHGLCDGPGLASRRLVQLPRLPRRTGLQSLEVGIGRVCEKNRSLELVIGRIEWAPVKVKDLLT
jgi:hypothetical protein